MPAEMDDFTPNELLGLAELFRLSAMRPQQPLAPGNVFVLVPAEDCRRLSALLLAESIRRREAPRLA
jgi:hypothetical protein